MMQLSNHSVVTPLRFVSHADADGTARRRLRLQDGWRLAGNLHTLGYFAANICVGTPPKTFNLIVGARAPSSSTCSTSRRARPSSCARPATARACVD